MSSGDDPTPTSNPTPGTKDNSDATIEFSSYQLNAEALPLIRSLGPYQVLREIARGGMGIVYEARHEALDRAVALKTLPAGTEAHRHVLRRFLTEAESIAHLRHPNIISIHDVGRDGEQHFFCMELIEGPSLARMVKEGPLAGTKAAAYLKPIADAIAYAHSQGILHRDLKPSNILIDSAHDRPVVTDFGLAKRLEGDSEITATGMILGTPSYMSPEQAGGKKEVGPASDVYGLGAVLYHLLTGKSPFQGETPFDTIMMVLDQEPVSPRLLNPKVPAELESVCMKCLEKHPAKRYATAKELANDLERFLSGEPVKAKPPSLSALAGAWYGRQLKLFGKALLMALLLSLPGMLCLCVGTKTEFYSVPKGPTNQRVSFLSFRFLKNEYRWAMASAEYWELAAKLLGLFYLAGVGAYCAEKLKVGSRSETLIVGSACGAALFFASTVIITIPEYYSQTNEQAEKYIYACLKESFNDLEQTQAGVMQLSPRAMQRLSYLAQIPLDERLLTYARNRAKYGAYLIQIKVLNLLMSIFSLAIFCLGAGIFSAYMPTLWRETIGLKGNWLSRSPFDYKLMMMLSGPVLVMIIIGHLMTPQGPEPSYFPPIFFGIGGVLLLSLVVIMEHSIRHASTWQQRNVSPWPLAGLTAMLVTSVLICDYYRLNTGPIFLVAAIFLGLMGGHYFIWRWYQDHHKSVP